MGGRGSRAIIFFYAGANTNKGGSMSDDLKFGPAPEPNAHLLLVLHFLACLAILSAIRPPVFMCDGRPRYLLIMLSSAALTYLVGSDAPSDLCVVPLPW